MAIQRTNPDTTRHRIMPENERFSAVVKAGNMVFTCGHTASNPDGDLVGPGDVEAQIRQTWHNVEESMKAAGGSLRNIVKVTTYVTDIIALPTWYKVWNELFELGDRPASTFVEVSRLAKPGLMVEIEAIGVLDQ